MENKVIQEYMTREEIQQKALAEIQAIVACEVEFTLTNCDSDPLTVEDFIADVSAALQRRLGE